MPFGKEGTPEYERNLEIYRSMIKPVIEKCGYRSVRADELEHMGNITHDIIELLRGADLVVADLSGRNANVYYELGVRHTLFKCGTIPIIRQGEPLPFDIANYRAIYYSIELGGPEKFRRDLERRIKTFDRLGQQKSDNPVYDILGDGFFFKSEEDVKAIIQDVERLRAERQQLAEQHKTLSERYSAQDAKIRKADEQRRQYEKRIKELEQQLFELTKNKSGRRKKTSHKEAQHAAVNIGRRPPQELNENDVIKILKQYDFIDINKNPDGQGVKHDYLQEQIQGDKVVSDKTTGLMWQQSGSDSTVLFKDAQSWINKINAKGYAGYKDWRLPTLEEAMSLMERSKKNDLYINPVFDRKQYWIWTCDTEGSREARVWVVNFSYGSCGNRPFDENNSFVRAVRS